MMRLFIAFLLVTGSSIVMADDNPFTDGKADQPAATNRVFPPTVLGTIPRVIDNAEDLDGAVNSLVVVRGRISTGKIRRVLGVEVVVNDKLEPGKEVFAVGILRKFENMAGPPNVARASNGARVRFVLYSDLQGKISEAFILNDQPIREPSSSRQPSDAPE